jgi:phosphatidylinositol-3-phosphatase
MVPPHRKRRMDASSPGAFPGVGVLRRLARTGRGSVAGSVAVLAAVALAACGASPSSTASPGPAVSGRLPSTRHVCGTRAGRPVRPTHVVWIVMENEAYSSVIGSRSAPYLNRLARACGLATRFSAEAHPSLPNYIAMTSGSTQGIEDDDDPGSHRIGAASIFSQLGSRWQALEESMPRPCLQSDDGQYAVRHNPAAYYVGIRGRCARQDVPLRGARVTAPFTFVTPNLCNDMHSCPVRDGDRWLQGWLPRLFGTKQYRSGSTVVFITWDEDDRSARQHIPTLVVSPDTRPGTRSATAFDHYALLATTEDLLGVPRLGAAARAPSMSAAFGLG